jgi:NAD dependent epimerase/dehydratase
MTTLAGRSVFVTGADGFIGSHLVEQLVRDGANVSALVYYNSWNSIGWLADVDPLIMREIKIVRGDIRDAELVRSAGSSAEYIFHLASLISIPHSYSSPRTYVETNVTGALNVLEAARQSDRLEKMLLTSTSEVYGTAQFVPITEQHPLVGQSPYSATKIGADMLAASYHHSFGLPVVIARPFNTFGPRQTARAVIPIIASQLLSGARELRLGALTPTRDFNYVTDTVGGMIAVARSSAVGTAINIGSGKEYSIQETAEKLMTITGSRVPIVEEASRLRPARSEVNRLLADNSVIRRCAGWSPKVSFEEGLRLTVKWIERNLHCFRQSDGETIAMSDRAAADHSKASG